MTTTLGDLFRSLWPDGIAQDFLPDDAVCRACNRIVGDHPAVLARMEAIRERQRMVRERDEQHRPLTGQTTPPNFPTCRCDRPLAEDFRAAGLPLVVDRAPDDPATFENYRAARGEESPYEVARAWACGEVSFHTLTFFGATGSGKSHLAEAAARLIVTRNAECRRETVRSIRERRAVTYRPLLRVCCTRTPTLLDTLRACFQSHAEDTLAETLWRYISPDVLVLDDLGSEKSTDFAREQLLRIVHERMTMGRHTLITTNEDPLSLAEKYDDRLASRLFDRRGTTVRAVMMPDRDHRRNP